MSNLLIIGFHYYIRPKRLTAEAAKTADETEKSVHDFGTYSIRWQKKSSLSLLKPGQQVFDSNQFWVGTEKANKMPLEKIEQKPKDFSLDVKVWETAWRFDF